MANPLESARSTVLNLLNGQRGAPLHGFSPLSTITAPALETRGLLFHEIHHDAKQMAVAAASAHELYGWQAANLPTDLIVEAEALGAQIDFRADMPEPMWSLVSEPLFYTPAEVAVPRGDIAQRGRIPLVCEGIRELKARVGDKIAVGAWIAGPFTLGLYTVDYDTFLVDVKRAPREVARALDEFTDALITVAHAYRNAGADFITIHEMGGSPSVVGPSHFETLLLPRLKQLVAGIPAPTILSVCGNTNNAMELLAQAGASALHVDQTNDLKHSREILGKDAVLLGNLDPVTTLVYGTPEQIRAAVERAAAAGASAVTPGCDLYLATPEENMLAFEQATRAFNEATREGK